MKPKVLFFGLAFLFSSLIGCQQTEKIITKIDTVKSITVKYDTVVLNKKDTVVIVNKDTIYISNNPTTQSDGEITGIVTIGNVTHSIYFSMNIPVKDDNSEETDYDSYDTAADGSISYFNVWRSQTGFEDNYIWIEDFTESSISQIDFSFDFVENNIIYNVGGMASSLQISNFSFNQETNDLSFDFEFETTNTNINNTIKFTGSFKGKVYQSINNN